MQAATPFQTGMSEGALLRTFSVAQNMHDVHGPWNMGELCSKQPRGRDYSGIPAFFASTGAVAAGLEAVCPVEGVVDGEDARRPGSSTLVAVMVAYAQFQICATSLQGTLDEASRLIDIGASQAGGLDYNLLHDCVWAANNDGGGSTSWCTCVLLESLRHATTVLYRGEQTPHYTSRSGLCPHLCRSARLFLQICWGCGCSPCTVPFAGIIWPKASSGYVLQVDRKG